MICPEAQDAWHQQADGELSLEGRASLALHLEGCAACRQYAAEMDAIASALDDLRDASHHVGSVAAPGRRRLTLGSAGRLAAAIALIVGAGLFLGRGGIEKNGARPSPDPTLSPASVQRTAGAQVVLAAGSADRYILVPQESQTPNVHVFVLFETP